MSFILQMDDDAADDCPYSYEQAKKIMVDTFKNSEEYGEGINKFIITNDVAEKIKIKMLKTLPYADLDSLFDCYRYGHQFRN